MNKKQSMIDASMSLKVLIAGLVCIMAVGCSQAPAPSEPETVTVVTNPADEAPATVETPAKPAKQAAKKPAPVKDAPPKPKGPENLIRNASFETWDANGPEGWMSWPNGMIAKSTDAKGSRTAVELKQAAGEEEGTQIRQRIRNATDIPGKVLRVECDVKTDNASAFILKAKWNVGETPKGVVRRHSGTGEWKTVSMRAEIPADAHPDSFEVTLYRDSAQEGLVLVDNASVTIRGPLGATAETE